MSLLFHFGHELSVFHPRNKLSNSACPVFEVKYVYLIALVNHDEEQIESTHDRSGQIDIMLQGTRSAKYILKKFYDRSRCFQGVGRIATG